MRVGGDDADGEDPGGKDLNGCAVRWTARWEHRPKRRRECWNDGPMAVVARSQLCVQLGPVRVHMHAAADRVPDSIEPAVMHHVKPSALQ